MGIKSAVYNQERFQTKSGLRWRVNGIWMQLKVHLLVIDLWWAHQIKLRIYESCFHHFFLQYLLLFFPLLKTEKYWWKKGENRIRSSLIWLSYYYSWKSRNFKGKIAALPYNLQSFYLSEPVIVWLHTENKKRGLLKTEFCLKSTSKFINKWR